MFCESLQRGNSRAALEGSLQSRLNHIPGEELPDVLKLADGLQPAERGVEGVHRLEAPPAQLLHLFHPGGRKRKTGGTLRGFQKDGSSDLLVKSLLTGSAGDRVLLTFTSTSTMRRARSRRSDREFTRISHSWMLTQATLLGSYVFSTFRIILKLREHVRKEPDKMAST